MSSVTTPAYSKQNLSHYWSKIAPYVVPPLAASIAIVPAFPDMIAKSALQKGLPLPSITVLESLKIGVTAAPTVGAIVGTQMLIQRTFEEKLLGGKSEKPSFLTTLASSAIVGTISAPVLAIFNGQTMGRSWKESLRLFSLKQGGAIALQETAFVCGLSVADWLADVMKRSVGDNKGVEYAAAFLAGAAGSLAGHPANTALTRLQSNQTFSLTQHSMLGAARKARAVGCFAVIYKLTSELMNSKSSKS